MSDTICEICNAETESTLHSLFDCEAAQLIWQECEIVGVIDEAPTTSFVDKWKWLTKKLTASELQIAASLMWVTWACRNKMLYEHERPDFIRLALGYVRLSKDYCSYAKKVFMPAIWRTNNVQSSWICPPSGKIKVNTDAFFV